MHPTRKRIIVESLKLFQRHGYHGTGISAILDAAQVPKGSLYHHFPDGKEDVALAALSWLRGEIEHYLDELDAKGATGQAMIEGMANFSLQLAGAGSSIRGSLFSVLAAECIPDAPRIALALMEAVQGIEARLANGFERQGVRDPAAAASGALALLEGATTLARIHGDRELLLRLVAKSGGDGDAD